MINKAIKHSTPSNEVHEKPPADTAQLVFPVVSKMISKVQQQQEQQRQIEQKRQEEAEAHARFTFD